MGALVYLRPGRGEPFGARSLEAGREALWLVALVTAALWKFFKDASFQSSTHHLTLTHAAATRGITLTKTALMLRVCLTKTNATLFRQRHYVSAFWQRG